MTRDRRELQSWYREAMVSRIDELEALRPEVEEGSAPACDSLRKIGQALRGSGGTFGFSELSAAAGLVETTTDEAGLRRLEGLLVELRRLVGDERGEGDRVFAWLGRCVHVPEEKSDFELDESLRGIDTVDEAWAGVTNASGLEADALARAVADRFGLEVASLGEGSRAARRLVPEAFMSETGVVPLFEDSTSITVATADPVSLPIELELLRLTGRRPVYAVAPPSILDQALGLPTVGVRDPAPPVAEPSAATEGRDAEADAAVWDEEPSRVLVVDDEESARLLVRSLLEKKGFSTVEAADGIEALEVIRERQDIGLAVVDLDMPHMDGLELMWRLREAREWARLPVIVVTGENDEIVETKIMEEGADDYIRKPVDPRLFLARVEATLRRTWRASIG